MKKPHARFDAWGRKPKGDCTCVTGQDETAGDAWTQARAARVEARSLDALDIVPLPAGCATRRGESRCWGTCLSRMAF